MVSSHSGGWGTKSGDTPSTTLCRFSNTSQGLLQVSYSWFSQCGSSCVSLQMAFCISMRLHIRKLVLYSKQLFCECFVLFMNHLMSVYDMCNVLVLLACFHWWGWLPCAQSVHWSNLKLISLIVFPLLRPGCLHCRAVHHSLWVPGSAGGVFPVLSCQSCPQRRAGGLLQWTIFEVCCWVQVGHMCGLVACLYTIVLSHRAKSLSSYLPFHVYMPPVFTHFPVSAGAWELGGNEIGYAFIVCVLQKSVKIKGSQ